MGGCRGGAAPRSGLSVASPRLGLSGLSSLRQPFNFSDLSNLLPKHTRRFLERIGDRQRGLQSRLSAPCGDEPLGAEPRAGQHCPRV